MKVHRRVAPPQPTPSRLTREAARSAPRAPGHSPLDHFVAGRTGGTTRPTRNANDLTNDGGRVLQSPTFQPIYLGAYWQTAAGKADAGFNDGFAKEVVGGAHQAILGQYGVGAGSYGGSATVGTSSPASVTRDDVVALVKQQIAAGAVKDGPQTVHLVVLAPGTVLDAGNGVTSAQGLGGFHGSYLDGAGKTVYFGVVAYSQGSNGIDFTGQGRDNVTITESHEFDEACTDPDVEGGKLAWYNRRYGEIGDLAVNSGLVPLDKAFVRDAAGYAVQVEWSNADHAFEGVAPAAKPKPKPAG